jgi:glycerol-3-phosphate acyltransferase PlsX
MSAPQTLTVALDAMGGDYGPSVIVPAALRALKRHDSLHLTLVGNREAIEDHLPRNDARLHRVTVEHASQTVGMDEAPAQALRVKKDSSMRVALNLVTQGRSRTR